MKRLRIDVSDSIYEHIIFFLKSLPSNLIRISDVKVESSQQINSVKNKVEELFKKTNIKTFQNIDNPVTWQQRIRDEWE